MKNCCIFDLTAEEFFNGDNQFELAEDYGKVQYGNRLYDLDSGGRMLLKCKLCGAYVLKQVTEFHGSFDDDAEYVTYWPVEGPEEADKLNREYAGDLARTDFADKRSFFQEIWYEGGGSTYTKTVR